VHWLLFSCRALIPPRKAFNKEMWFWLHVGFQVGLLPPSGHLCKAEGCSADNCVKHFLYRGPCKKLHTAGAVESRLVVQNGNVA
jgi:hypothetical protein